MPMQSRLVLFLITIVIFSFKEASYAQSLKADSNTLKGVVWLGGQIDPYGVKEVKVKLWDKNRSKVWETSSDANGSFTITIPESVNRNQKFVLLLYKKKSEGDNKHYYSKIYKKVLLKKFPQNRQVIVAGKYKRTSSYYFTKRYLKHHPLTKWLYAD